MALAMNTAREEPDPGMPTLLFNSENARLYAAKSLVARREAKLRRIEAEQMAKQIQAQAVAQAGTYSGARLLRVREQLDRIDLMMMEEDDPQRLDRLAAAQAKLAEQERILDGRPLPGSRKPAPDRANRVAPPTPPVPA